MPGITLAPRNTSFVTPAKADPGLGDFYKTLAYDALYHSPVGVFGIGGGPKGSVQRYSELVNERLFSGDNEVISPEEARQQFGLDGLLTFEEPVTVGEASLLQARKMAEFRREHILGSGSIGLHRSVTGFGVNIVATAVDPVNLASMFVPVVGEAKMLQGVNRARRFFGTNLQRGLISPKTLARFTGTGKTPFRLSKGFIEGTIGAALVEPLVLIGAVSEQSNYGWDDSALNVIIGGVLGSSLHGIGGVIRDKFVSIRADLDRLDPQTHDTAVMAAISDLVQDRPVTGSSKIIHAAKRGKAARIPGQARGSVSNRNLIQIAADQVERLRFLRNDKRLTGQALERFNKLEELMKDPSPQTMEEIADLFGLRIDDSESRFPPQFRHLEGAKNSPNAPNKALPGVGDVIEFNRSGERVQAQVTRISQDPIAGGSDVPIVAEIGTGVESPAPEFFGKSGRVVKKAPVDDLPAEPVTTQAQSRKDIEATARQARAEDTPSARRQQDLDNNTTSNSEVDKAPIQKKSDPIEPQSLETIQDEAAELTAQVAELEQALGNTTEVEANFLDTLAKQVGIWADAKIKDAHKRLNIGIDPELLAAYLAKGAVLFYKGAKTFTEWSAKAVGELGHDAIPHFRDLYELSKTLVTRKVYAPVEKYLDRKPNEISKGLSKEFLKRYGFKNPKHFEDFLNEFDIDPGHIIQTVDAISSGRVFTGGAVIGELEIRKVGNEYHITGDEWVGDDIASDAVDVDTLLMDLRAEKISSPEKFFILRDGIAITSNRRDVEGLISIFSGDEGDPRMYLTGRSPLSEIAEAEFDKLTKTDTSKGKTEKDFTLNKREEVMLNRVVREEDLAKDIAQGIQDGINCMLNKIT